jgi:hypothetical protein
MFLGVKMITSNRDAYQAIETDEEVVQEWQQYNEWNEEHQDLWNPPHWPTNGKADASSPLLVGHSSVPIPNSVLSTPPQLRPPRHAGPRPLSTTSTIRTPQRASLDEDTTLRRLSTVLDSMGTHGVRRLELDYLSELAQFPKSPSRSEH